MAANDKHSILGSSARDKLALYALYAICAAAVIAELFIHRHVEQPLEALPAFFAVFAFLCIVVLIMGAKLLRLLVGAKEDYYDE